MPCPRGHAAVSLAVRAAKDSPASSTQPTKVIGAFRWRPSPTGGTATHGSNPPQFPFSYHSSNTPSPLHQDTILSIFVSFPFLFGSHVLERMPSRMCLSPRRLIRILRGRSVSSFLFSLRSFGPEGGTHKSMTQHERFGGVCFFTNIPGAYGTMDEGSPCGWAGERRGGTYRVGGIIYMHCLRLGSPALFERGAVEQHITLNNTHLDCCCCVDDGCGL